MKLLVFHDKPRGELGGMNAFIAAQNALFTRAGLDVVEVVCTPTPQPGAMHLPPSGRRLGQRAARQIDELIDRSQPDAVIAHSVYYALGPSALRRLQQRVATLYLLHDVTPLCPRETRLTRAGTQCQQPQGLRCIGSGCYRIGERGRWWSDAHGLLMRGLQAHTGHGVNQWVVPSRYLCELLQLHGIAAARIAVVPHFVDAAPAAELPQAVPGRLLYAGRLVHEKGIGVLLEALRALRAPGWTLHLAGAGPERDGIERVIAQHGWQNRVLCLGALSPGTLALQYAQASVVVMPSLISESFGLVGLEAMLRGRPVVGFASGGMSEWLREGVNGRVAAWGNSAALALAIDDLLTQPLLAHDMGLRGRRIAEREFSAALHLDRMLELLGRTAARHSTRSVAASTPTHQAAQAGP